MIKELKPCPEMVEKVARAIEEAVGTSGNYLVAHMTAEKAARAAIAAYDPDKRLSPSAIFEMGFEWAMSLRGQTLEDSRAVGRTLFSDTFTPIADALDTSDFNSFESADAGIAAAKQIIHAALDAALSHKE